MKANLICFLQSTAILHVVIGWARICHIVTRLGTLSTTWRVVESLDTITSPFMGLILEFSRSTVLQTIIVVSIAARGSQTSQ